MVSLNAVIRLPTAQSGGHGERGIPPTDPLHGLMNSAFQQLIDYLNLSGLLYASATSLEKYMPMHMPKNQINPSKSCPVRGDASAFSSD